MSNYIFDKIPFNNCSDVFLNEMDITWMAGTENLEKKYTILPTEVAEDDGMVEYSFNKQGFRCDDFVNTHSGKHILFSGCSNTEGVGGSLDTVWSKITYDKLIKSYDISGFYSIARSGFGWQKIITNFDIYCQKYGTPDYFFVLLPNIGRFFEWIEENNYWQYVQRYVSGPTLPNSDINTKNEVPFIDRPLTKKEYREKFIDFTITWKLFENLCEAKGVKLIWSTWKEEDTQNIIMANSFKNFFPLKEEDFFKFIKKERPDGNLKFRDLSRRDGHYGELWNEFWSESFINEINKKGLMYDKKNN